MSCASPKRPNAIWPSTAALPEAQRTALEGQIALGRLGEAQDIADAVAFLASSRAGYITGTTLHVNGGMLMV